MDKSLIRRKLPFLYSVYLFITQYEEDKKLIGERKYFGDKNPDKFFFVIIINNYGLGLMGIYGCVLGYLRIAKKNGFIPVVDLKNYNNGYLEKEELGKINSWEYYFEQPTQYSLNEVYQSKNVIMASGISPREASPIPLTFYYLSFFKTRAQEYYNIINSQIKLKSSIQQIIELESQKLIRERRIIGVVKRGSDIINAPGHQIQPSMSDLISKTKDMLKKWNCEYVFLATEEANTVVVFKEVFGDKLLINNSERIQDYQDKVPYTEISFNRKNDKYLKGLEYLTTVALLSKCTCLIGSLVGATVGAIGMNNGKYEHTYIYELGVYK